MTRSRDNAPRSHQDIKTSVRKGLIMIHTGQGKGKSSAAWGIALRAMGWGHKVGIVQFMKGRWKTGEATFLKKFPDQCKVLSLGKNFTWVTRNYKDDVLTAQKAWKQCCNMLADDQYFLVIFDEINYAMKYNFLDSKEVVARLKSKPLLKHVILTGDGAPKALIRIADLVTEMKYIKHPYQQGIKAQAGIEY